MTATKREHFELYGNLTCWLFSGFTDGLAIASHRIEMEESNELSVGHNESKANCYHDNNKSSNR